MKRYILKIRGILCCSVVLSLANAVINALMLLFPGWLIDGFSKGLPYIVKLMVAYAVLFVLYLINAYLSNRASDYRRINFEKAIKKDFFDAVIQRDFQSFHKYDVAEYISMQTNDISEMCMNYMNPLFSILDATVMIAIFGTSLVIFVNINIALIILLFSALIVFVPRLTANNLAKRNGAYLENVGQYTSIVKTLYEAHAILDRKGRKKITQLHGRALDHVMNLFNHFRRLNSFAMVLNGGSVELISLVVFAVVAILLCKIGSSKSLTAVSLCGKADRSATAFLPFRSVAGAFSDIFRSLTIFVFCISDSCQTFTSQQAATVEPRISSTASTAATFFIGVPRSACGNPGK